MRSKNWKNIVVILCIIIIAYTSIVFLPHIHDCARPDCTVCTLIETSRNSLIGLALIAVVYQFVNIFHFPFPPYLPALAFACA